MIFLFTLLLLVVLDQLTKYIALKNNPSTYINRGIFFGLFKRNHYAAWLYTIGWLGVAFYLYLNAGLNNFSLGLIIGGTISNKIDRFRVGGAIDWVDLWGPIRRFNIADIGIALGLTIWLISLIIK